MRPLKEATQNFHDEPARCGRCTNVDHTGEKPRRPLVGQIDVWEGRKLVGVSQPLKDPEGQRRLTPSWVVGPDRWGEQLNHLQFVLLFAVFSTVAVELQ